MKIAYILYDGITYLDFIGIYDPISRLKSMKYIPDLSWDICSNKAQIEDCFGLKIVCDKVLNDLSDYDMIIIPGGFGTRQLQADAVYMSWLKTAELVPYKLSICTGSLLLGAAGFLKGKKATTHFDEYETLKPYCQKVLKKRIVEDGKVITAGAVSTSLDLGLYICEKLVGKEARETIRKRMDYRG
jgi:transcriptional regulator GlxA family with amidase domain